MRKTSRRPLSDRFWEKVAIRGDGDCWEWVASRTIWGYGQVGKWLPNGKHTMARANRVAWELTHGDIPDGLHVCHKCDNRGCVNPSHLFLGTRTDNMQDASVKGRLNGPGLQGVNHGMAKINEAKVKIIRYVGASVPHKRLAELFGVTPNLIRQVVQGKIWKSVRIAE